MKHSNIKQLANNLNSTDRITKVKFLRQLSKSSVKQFLNVIVNLLQDPDAFVREEALYALGRSNASQVIAPMIAQFDDPNSSVRSAAYSSLFPNFKAQVKLLLIDILQNRQLNNRVRATAAAALSEYQSDLGVSEALTKNLDVSDEIRINIIESLGRLGDPRSIPFLLPMLSDQSNEVREIIIWSLGEFYDDEIAITSITPFLKDTDSNVRAMATRKLADVASRGNINTFKTSLAGLASVMDAEVVKMPEILSSKDTLQLFINALKDEDRRVQQNASMYLGEINVTDSHIKDELANLMNLSLDQEVRFWSAWALARLKDTRGINILIGAIENGSKRWCRLRAAEALSYLDDIRSFRALSNVLQDPNLRLRKIAIAAIENFSKKSL